MNEFFGQRYDAPAWDDAVEIDTPVGQLCLYCSEPIAEDDSGSTSLAYVGGSWVKAVQHIECCIRSALGSVEHLEGKCFCYDKESQNNQMSWREEGLAVMKWVEAKKGKQA